MINTQVMSMPLFRTHPYSDPIFGVFSME